MSEASAARALEQQFGRPSARNPFSPPVIPRPPSSGYNSGSIPTVRFPSVSKPPSPPFSPPIPKPSPAFGLGALGKLFGRAIPFIGLGLTIYQGLELGGQFLNYLRDSREQNPIGQETPESRGVPPFLGGQQDGVTYDINATFQPSGNASGNQIQTYGRVAIGPLGLTKETVVDSRVTKRFMLTSKSQPPYQMGISRNFEVYNPDVTLLTFNAVPRTGTDTSNPPNEGGTPYGRTVAPPIESPPYAPEYLPPTAPKPRTSPNNPNNSPNKDPRRVGTPIGNPFPSTTPSPNGNPSGNPTPSPSPNNSPSPSTGLSPSKSINFSPSPLPTFNPDIQSPSTQPRPSEREQTRPNTPNSPTPPPPDLRPDLDKIKEQQKEDFNKLSGLIIGIPAILAGATVFRDAVKNSAKEATCEAAAPDGCLGSKLDADKQEIKDEVSNGNEGVRATLAGILEFLRNMFEWIQKAFNNTIVDKAISYLTLITTIHNAAMLSTSIKDTLGDAISLGLATINIKGPEDQPIDINEAINKSTENLLKGVVGADNYTALKETWAKASRIWQSGAAIIYNVRSLWDSSRSLDELTGNNIGRIGNALRRDGVVSENAYKTMSENVTVVNTAMNKLQSLDDSVSTLAAITSETYGITENVLELTKQKEDFEKNIKDFAPKTQIENDPLKAREDTQNAVSQAPEIPLTELYKPDI